METNVIYNEDCYTGIKKIPDKSIDLVYIDIPYDIAKNGGGGCFGSNKRDYHKEYEKVCENTERIKKKVFKIFLILWRNNYEKESWRFNFKRGYRIKR